ncbi:hypothetical protein MASR1M31_06900 [Porphyromonadaceae bacterium]
MGIKTVTIPVQLEEEGNYNLREIEVDEDTFQLNEVSVTAKSEARLKQSRHTPFQYSILKNHTPAPLL